ncbi:class I SAM-dependent methyltransferase [Cellulomonas fimi]|uniref:Class I SAM-dependent methyltransferase n=1 Tax=Cellulomonas fimi TaxID=1708 RepID=A0A7Y0LZ24_CELFI|nr:class I SAM-dependent methyltransferase [Cellulomonas fimi]NMR20862.1 class I SAM-dependent methyltransferase [Cellulomonas fimi]
MPGPDYDEAYYAANGQLGDRPALRYYTRLVGRYVRPRRVLDVGCGTGHLLARMSARWPADGLELSAYSASVARTVSPSSTVWESPGELPAAAYDGLTAIHVFEHIPDDELTGLLAALRRASADDARLLVVVPDPAGRASRLHGAAWNGLTDPTHVNLKPHADWRELFGSHGLRVEREGSDGLWNFPYSRLPVPLDALRHGLPMAAQFLSGRMLLSPGAGESSFFVLSWA